MNAVCFEEVTDEDGFLDVCFQPAVAERIDPVHAHLYPVCQDHLGPRNIEWDRGRARWVVTDSDGRIVGRFRAHRLALAAMREHAAELGGERA